MRKTQSNGIKALIPLLFQLEPSVQIYPLVSHLHTSAHIPFAPTAPIETQSSLHTWEIGAEMIIFAASERKVKYAQHQLLLRK